MSGPLTGISVIEFAGIGPGPFAGMLLCDLGAEVIRVVRPGGPNPLDIGLFNRGKRSVAIDLKKERGREIALRLITDADILIEGFRPGVMEGLGLGPDICLIHNERLVYGRMTGWGQDGPLADTAGHDIDYIAVAGALGAIGEVSPVPPLNLVGDFGGGALYLVVGVLSGVISATASGRGQVVDAAIVDGAASLTTMVHGMLAMGTWTDRRWDNLLDGGAPFYATYRTADERYVAVGALEPRFYAELLAGLSLADTDLPDQMDREGWPELRERFAAIFATRPRSEWEAVFAGSDACVAGVWTLGETASHPHLEARGTFVDVDGLIQPGPAPRFSETPPSTPRAPSEPGGDTRAVLIGRGVVDADEFAVLQGEGIVP